MAVLLGPKYVIKEKTLGWPGKGTTLPGKEKD